MPGGRVLGSGIAQPVTFSISRAPSAAAATASRSLSIDASTAAITAPSTKGALLSRTRPLPSASCSIAICVLSTALPRSTRTRTPSGPRTSSIAPRIAVASVPSRPSAVPPATAIFTLPWVIWAASSRTPSASWRLCETSTMLTVPISPRQDLERVGGGGAGAMLDLHAAGLAVGEDVIAAGGLDGLEEPAADLHREVVLLDLHAECPRDAATALVDLLEVDARDQPQQSHRGIADPMGFQVAGRVVEEAHRNGLKVRVQLACLMEHPEVLHDVVRSEEHTSELQSRFDLVC